MLRAYMCGHFCVAASGFCALSFIGQTVSAGAWPSAVGQGQIISTTVNDRAKTAYNENGKADTPVDFSKLDTALYWEHGLSEDLTIVLNSSLQEIKFSAGVDQVEFQGLGESGLGLRSVIWQNQEAVLSGQVSVIFPSSGETVSDADLGFGAVNYELRLLAGRSFKLAERDGFVDVQAAWRLRPSGGPDEYRVDAALGWRPQENVQLLAQGFYAHGNGKFAIARQNSRLKLQGSVVYDRNAKTSYQIGAYQTVAGQNIVKEKAVFIGVWQRY